MAGDKNSPFFSLNRAQPEMYKSSLRDREEDAGAIRALLSGCLIPKLERAASKKIHLGRHGGNGAPSKLSRNQEELEQHPYPEVCISLRGEAEIMVGGELIVLADGDTLVIPPGVVHSPASLHCVMGDPKKVYSQLLWVDVFPYGVVLNRCESIYGTHRSTPRQLFLDRHVNARVQNMILELEGEGENYLLMAKCYLLQALTCVTRSQDAPLTDGSLAAVNAVDQKISSCESPVGRARKLLHQKFDSHITLDAVARAVCTNKSHLCREFKREVGLTVIEYLTKVRIEASKRLLLTGVKISVIAELVGFEDPYYFSRVFSKATGVSPLEFRRQQASTENPHDTVSVQSGESEPHSKKPASNPIRNLTSSPG
jgi:AraC-like DNA-binding protein